MVYNSTTRILHLNHNILNLNDKYIININYIERLFPRRDLHCHAIFSFPSEALRNKWSDDC